MANILTTLQAVSDPTRFRLVEIIAKGEICSCKLPSKVGVSQSGVSQHLRVLKDANLVSVRRDGTKRLYSLSAVAKKIFSDIKGWRR